MDKWLGNLVTVVITLVWAASLVVGWVKPQYSPPMTLQLAMGAVVGALYGRKALQAPGDNTHE